MSTLTMRVPLGAESRLRDAVAQRADAFDLELDHVPGLEPAAVSVLEDAACADGSRAQHVARSELRVARGVREDRVPRVVHVGELAARSLLAVDAGKHRSAPPVELVGRDDDRPEARGEVL